MLPTLGKIGPITLRTYTLLLDLSILLGLGVLAWQGWRTDYSPARWVDGGLAALLAGMAGGRLGHVVVHWAYFTHHRAEILQVWRGGLDWHAAVLLGLLALGAYSVLRRMPFYYMTDSLALVVPIGAALAWTGCLMSGCAYGAEVRSLADYPSPIIAELPDLFGLVAPRFTSQLFGAAYSILVAIVAAVLALIIRRAGLRLWVSLLLLALGTFAIGYTRGDLVPIVYGLRLDQLLDLAMAGLALLGLLVSLAVTQFYEQIHPPSLP